jgi:hypothetical protein
MTDVMITDGIKQQVITRLATINSAISILNLTKGKPANVGVEEVLTLAERIESWAWRDLLGERADTRAPEKPVPSKAEGGEPEPAAEKDNRSQPNLAPPKANGDGQRGGEASTKQINAIFGIGKSKGHSSEEIEAWIKKRFGKSVDVLTSREASKVIGDLQAL